MTLLSKKLSKTADKYINAYHGAIKIKPTSVPVDTYIDFDVGKHDKEPEFKAGDHVSISKNKDVFAKKYTPNWSEMFVIENVKGATKSYFTLYSCMVIVCLIQFYVDLHFLRFHLENYFLVFLYFL